jgi:hypothetical protein
MPTWSLRESGRARSGYVVSGEKDARSDGKATATFHFKAPKAGEYKVLIAYYAHGSRGKNLHGTIIGGTRERKLTVNQIQPLPVCEHFQPIDTAVLPAEVEIIIQIKTTDPNGFVLLDAVQLVPIK